MTTGFVQGLFIFGIFVTSANAFYLYKPQENISMNSIVNDDKALPSKRSLIVIDRDFQRMKAAGYDILPPSQDQKLKGLAAAKFMFHGRLGLFWISKKKMRQIIFLVFMILFSTI